MATFAFLGESEENTNRVFGLGRKEKVFALGDCVRALIGRQNLEEHKAALKGVRYAFCTWGMPNFTMEQIKKYFPSLECVFYAAGSVQVFARNFLSCGVRVFSAWAANAVPVAEAVFAQIVLANKGFFHTLSVPSYAQKTETALAFKGNFGTTVGLIGAGMIGSLVAEKLGNLAVNVVVFDPFLSDECASMLGVKKVDLHTLFESSDVISNHLANNDQTAGMLDYGCFSRMKRHAVFINSGRGRQVREADLIRALGEEQGRLAILDVTDPEPPIEGSPLYTMKNVILTPHIDGSWGNEVVRMADDALAAYECVISGQPCKSEVFASMLATMA
ncbi:MAG: hydroxyacid dehydrogenase [Clostridiales bacterium]|nr:hydroxyacid dehydrogenase [Clostridiales bacterium]